MLLRRRQNVRFILWWMAACAATLAGARECSHTPPGCADEACVTRWECGDQALCGHSGSCECPPCFSGDACDEYDDGNPIVLEKASDEITIRADHSGLVYSIIASDADQSDACSDILPESFFTDCPCGGIEYGPLTLQRPTATENPFSLDPVTGEITKRAQVVMEAGETYYLQAAVRPYKTLNEVPSYTMNLTVSVTPAVSAVEGDMTESAFLHSSEVHEPKPNRDGDSKKLSRKKRDAKGEGASATNMSLTVVGTDPTDPLLPGQSISYELTIIVPKLTTPMDLLVEIFVMDAVSGITPFTLCNIEIAEFGSMITDENDNPLSKDSFTPEVKENSFFPGAKDRATIDFGNLKNGASVGGTDYTDSTILILFDASLIPNPDYVNDTVIVTAGAEYDSDNYVWVSQASYGFNMDSSYSYPSKIEIDGPDVGAPNSGATFTISAFITDPAGPLIFEVYTPTQLHNKFTVSNLAVGDVGENMKCTGIPDPEFEFFYSVDKKTYHRGVAKFDFFMTGLQYPDLVSQLNDTENKIELSFTVFFVDAVVDEIVSLGAGITIGTSTLWTSLINVTMGDPVTPDESITDYTVTVSDVGSNREVVPFGILTYALSIDLKGPGGALIACDATIPADHKITGIMWGECGVNIALKPNLTKAMKWDDTTGVTGWEFYLNSTGQITGSASVNTAVLEVSVQYLTSTLSDVTLSCGNVVLTGAKEGTGGTLDMSGSADAVNPGNTTWYQGGQQALLVKLTFPPGGAVYSDMVIETSSDFDVTNFGAQVCKLEIMNSGRGVPTIGGNMDRLNSLVTFSKISATSAFDDGAEMAVGPIAGVDRGNQTATGDNEVIVRLTYIFPKNQTIDSGVTYNVSLGIQLDSNLIWTGWTGFNTDASPPAGPTTILSKLTPPDITDLEIGRPTLVKFHFKMAPGSSDVISVRAYPAGGSATLFVCRILILAVGSSYPCVEPDPYGKERTNLAMPNTIIHDSEDWGKSATADFGVLTNVGYQEYFADEIADVDAIEIGVLVKGIVAGADDLNIDLQSSGGVETNAVAFSVAGDLVVAGDITGEWVPADGTNEAYEGVMKIVDLILTVPPGYGQPLKVVISNNDPASMKLCFAAVATAGKNVPCLLPHTVVPVVVETEALEEHTLDLSEVCYYDVVPGNVNESTITIRTGIQFTSIGTNGALEVAITEGGAPIATAPGSYSVTRSSTALDPASINTTTEGFEVTLVDNSTVEVHPGLSMFYGVNIIIPPDTTGLLEVGAMAPTDEGRAYATLHSVRWANESGKNVGCMLDMVNYEVKLLQNSSLSQSMIHESQTDTLVADLGFITNTGLSYMQNFPTEPDDNVVGLEVEIMMADHLNATDGSVIPVSIAVKFGDVIYVVTKELKLVRDAALDLMVLRTELNYTTEPATTIFKKDDQIEMTYRVSHVMNESREELNDAIVRVLLPQPLQFVDQSDTQVCNITNNFTNNHYLDFDIKNLFFTDYLELNLTVTVDPNDDMVKGLGVIDAAALVRMVCTTADDTSNPKYCGTTAVLPFQIEGTECYEPLGLGSMDPCQFSASTAIDATVGPDKAQPGSGGVWSPAVRSGPGWEHHITIDFLKNTRVTKIEFTAGAEKQVTQFKVSYSFNGASFISPCDVVISVTANVAELPPECRFEARYGRLTIVDATDPNTSFKVNFNEWYGCPMETVDDTCNALETKFTDDVGWRQMSYDSTNKIFYFCDYNPKKMRTVCFSTADGTTWNALPSYIGALVGESGGLFYARDSLGSATVSSTDGISWTVTDSATADALTPSATSVPGSPKGFTVVEGDYTASYDGITLNGEYVVKWESCCT